MIVHGWALFNLLHTCDVIYGETQIVKKTQNVVNLCIFMSFDAKLQEDLMIPS